MTTHRAIQIWNLLDIIRSKAVTYRIGASNLARIGNTKGAIYQTEKAQKCDRIAYACATRLEEDEVTRAAKDVIWAHEWQKQ